MKLVDTNVSYGFWPWMDFSDFSAEKLIEHLAAKGTDEAWISSVESILFPDPDVPDARLFSAFRNFPNVTPIKTLNPLLGNWRESLKRAVEKMGAKAVRILPSYHQYSLLDLPIEQFVSVLIECKIPLILTLRVEDERNQYPLMQVPTPSAELVVLLATRYPELKILITGATASEARSILTMTTNVFCEISFIEPGGGLADFLKTAPAERLLFGSHTPFFYTQAAVNKLCNAEIDTSTQNRIGHENAGAFLP
ncbi:MAG: amidohydrolase family protein [Chthoniobacterales bacterium]